LKKIGTEYSLVHGISLDTVINLIPNFDILTVDFMHYANDYWLIDFDLNDAKCNEKIFKSCDRFLWKFNHPCVSLSNNVFLASHIDWCNGVVRSIVIGDIVGVKYNSIINLYRTYTDKKIIMDKIKEYENI